MSRASELLRFETLPSSIMPYIILFHNLGFEKPCKILHRNALFSISKVCCELSLVYMSALLWVTFVNMCTRIYEVFWAF